jgi:hypothetical protein
MARNYALLFLYRVVLYYVLLTLFSFLSYFYISCHKFPTWGHVYIFGMVSGVRLSSLGIAATTALLYQPQMIDDGDCGEIGGMKMVRGNRSTRRKPAPSPHCPPQIPHDQTRAAAVGS